MAKLRCYVGWDQRDIQAYEVCTKTLLDHASIPIEIIPLKEWELRKEGVYWRAYQVDQKGQMWDDRDGKPFSTNFSFTRFCVPLLEEYRDEWVLFMDADMMWQSDVAELLLLRDQSKGMMCVKHDHRPPESSKMDGVIQTRYRRKNWSSLMLMNPSKCRGLTPYVVNNQTGAFLHSMCWIEEEMIGGLPEEWNWLEGWSSPDIEPKVIHYTRGTPDMMSNVFRAELWWSELATTKETTNG